jgi:hypothetical protein
MIKKRIQKLATHPLALPATAQRPRGEAEWEGKCVLAPSGGAREIIESLEKGKRKNSELSASSVAKPLLVHNAIRA